jgi:hypothetical protein
MTKGFTVHINSLKSDFEKGLSQILQENFGSLKGIKEIEVVLYDDSDLKTGVDERTGKTFNYEGGGKVNELEKINLPGVTFVFVGRPELEKYIDKLPELFGR